jgi:hypothetical protein
MTTFVAVFLAAWAAGYVLGWQVAAIRSAFNAST